MGNAVLRVVVNATAASGTWPPRASETKEESRREANSECSVRLPVVSGANRSRQSGCHKENQFLVSILCGQVSNIDLSLKIVGGGLR